MHDSQDLSDEFDPTVPLESAATVPSRWYTDADVLARERETVFAVNWVAVGRTDQAARPGQFFTVELAGEPLVVVRDDRGVLRAFYNVCRHHAAAVVPDSCGDARSLRCPYHGWNYALSGELKSAPEFEGVQDFDKSRFGLRPVAVDTWERFVFVRLREQGPALYNFLGTLLEKTCAVEFSGSVFFERREYTLDCNWKVFVDNYLDGGYHVPHIHKALGSVIRYADYRIELGERYNVQIAPLKDTGSEVASLRGGGTAYYFWVYPNFMINCYAGVMDTNLVFPLGVDRCRVVFDFYFEKDADPEQNRRSIELAEKIQLEDVGVCESVQRGLRSRSYDRGRFSVRREAGDHHFQRLLAADLAGDRAESSRRSLPVRAE